MKGSTNRLQADAINTESVCFPAITDNGSTRNMVDCIELFGISSLHYLVSSTILLEPAQYVELT